MTKQEIIDRIQSETIALLSSHSRENEIKTYIELWEKYKKDLTDD